ncbi:MAG TPA: YbaK/EbsC family protein [Thermoanaerobaculia bacterium]|jgi:alanine dehydrogenase|nr:YbaK/EbsC family protein [Thermoanaerobaculia bacterium]
MDDLPEALKALRSCIQQYHPLRAPKKRRVELLLGNDREIGRESFSQEKRVGIIPRQVQELVGFLRDVGVDLEVLVIQGAGQRAGFSDAEFIAAGAEIVTLEELPFDRGTPPDVVHALKEPSCYESTIPGPFCRIGAIHTGDFHADSGLAGLLNRTDVAIFDGSHTGAPDAYRIPIRGRMSIFAGEIAAEWVLDHLAARHVRGPVVMVGAGNAGKAAACKLVEDAAVTEVILLDSDEFPARLEQVRGELAKLAKIRVQGIRGMNHLHLTEALKGAVGVIFAVARPGEEAPKVVHIDTLVQQLAENAIVVDISIDEKGAILDPAIPSTWTSNRIIPRLAEVIGAQRNRVYRAIPNMPRAYPKPASEAHGEAILPYLATLLFLAAREGGAERVIRYLARQPFDGHGVDPLKAEPAQVLPSLIQDLRNGLAFFPHYPPGRPPGTQQGDRIAVSDLVADRAGLFAHLYRHEIAFEFAMPARGGAHREKEIAAARVFPDPIRDCLIDLVNHGLRCTVVSHPGIDGTTTQNAERALGVGTEKVLKCLIFRADDQFIAAICSGRKHISEELLRQLTGARKVELASQEEVREVTKHTKGGVPVIQVFGMERISAVYLDEEVLKQEGVYGSAGTEFAGMRIASSDLPKLGARVVRITPEDSRLRRSEKKVRRFLREIEHALEEDDDAAARVAVGEIAQILEGPAAGAE